jgi:hypothetical protein
MAAAAECMWRDVVLGLGRPKVGRPQLRPKAYQAGNAAPWQILDVNLFRRFPLTQDEFWHETGAIGSPMKLCFQPYIERPKPTPYGPGRPFYCALLLDSELDSNLNCFWSPPRGLEPNQPWTSFLTWKTLLDSIFSNPCTTHGHKHGCHVPISSFFILWRGISSFLSQRHFMYQIWIWKWNVKCLENVLLYHMC